MGQPSMRSLASRSSGHAGHTPVLVTDRAGGRGSYAATRASRLRVPSWDWARPVTAREKEEEKNWIREKNGRKVLKIVQGNGQYRYWRAPRPRPRPNRRRRRQKKRAVMEVALNGPPPQSASVNAAEVIVVLQQVLQAAIKEKEEAQEEAEKARGRLQKKKAKIVELQEQHAEEREEHAWQVHKLQEKLKARQPATQQDKERRGGELQRASKRNKQQTVRHNAATQTDEAAGEDEDEAAGEDDVECNIADFQDARVDSHFIVYCILILIVGLKLSGTAMSDIVVNGAVISIAMYFWHQYIYTDVPHT